MPGESELDRIKDKVLFVVESLGERATFEDLTEEYQRLFRKSPNLKPYKCRMPEFIRNFMQDSLIANGKWITLKCTQLAQVERAGTDNLQYLSGIPVSGATVEFFKNQSRTPVTLLYEYTQIKRLPQPEICDDWLKCVNGQNIYGRHFIIDGRSFAIAEATNKKLASQKAAVLALDCLIKDGEFSLGKKNVMSSTKIFHAVSLKLSQEISTLANSFAESHNFQEVSNMVQAKIFACIIEHNSIEETTKIISWASGNNCIESENLKQNGSVLFDCHAEILARRGWVRFLYNELKTNPSIRFRLIGNKYSLKRQFSYHLYVSRAPCGDGQIYTWSSEETEVIEESASSEPLTEHRPISTEQQHGVFRIKLEKGDGTPPWNTKASSNRLRTMSCSDKIFKWNVLGLQGCLLSNLLEPIYLQSIHINQLYHHGHLARALCCRGDKLELSKSKINHPVLINDNYADFAPKAGSDRYAYAWNAVDECFERLNPLTGMLADGGMSTLCKRRFYDDFMTALEITGRKFDARNYLEAKGAASKYSEAQKGFEEQSYRKRYGQWLHKREMLSLFQ